MGKKSNNELRHLHDEVKVQKKEKEYLINNGIDEELVEELIRVKRKRKGKEE